MKLLLIEGHPLFRMGARQLVESKWPGSIVLEAGTMAAARQAMPIDGLDAIALDLSLPDASGAEAVAQTLSMARGVPVLVVSAGGEAGMAAQLLRMGVAGFVSKSRAAAVVLDAIEVVAGGNRFVSPDLAEKLVGLLSAEAGSGLAHESLTTQEYRVMLLIAEGHGPTEIAAWMGLSVKTVGTYRARLLTKAGWSNNVELTKYCLRHGMPLRS